MLNALSAGISSELLFLVQVYFFKKYDTECSYPIPGYIWTALSFVLAGILAKSGTDIFTASVLMGFLIFAAYTDHYMKLLYTMPSLVTGFLGIFVSLRLHGLQDTGYILLGILPFFVLLLIFRACYAINSGDVEVFLALSIWMSSISYHPYLTGYWQICFMSIVSMLFAAILATVWTLCGIRAKTVAFAPYILVSEFVLLYCFG